jgi:hypothetical protein
MSKKKKTKKKAEKETKSYFLAEFQQLSQQYMALFIVLLHKYSMNILAITLFYVYFP